MFGRVPIHLTGRRGRRHLQVDFTKGEKMKFQNLFLLKVFEDSKETFYKKFLWRVQGRALLQ